MKRRRRRRRSDTGRYVALFDSDVHPLMSYPQLHEEGKTDQAKADLSRLTKIRAEREAAAAKRKAEAEGANFL